MLVSRLKIDLNLGVWRAVIQSRPPDLLQCVTVEESLPPSTSHGEYSGKFTLGIPAHTNSEKVRTLV